jgi:hypothetical protein
LGLDLPTAALVGLVAPSIGFGITVDIVLLLRKTSLFRRWAIRYGEGSTLQRIFLVVLGAGACLAAIVVGFHYFPAK